MRRTLCAIFLAGCSLLWPNFGLSAEGTQAEEAPAKEDGISSEDRQVIRRMELLQLMEMLKDMEMLEGELETVSEDKK